MDDTQVLAPMLGTVVRVAVGAGDAVRSGQTLVVLESMKMEHLVAAPHAGIVGRVLVGEGDTVRRDQPLLVLQERAESEPEQPTEADTDLDAARPDLAEVRDRHEIGWDAARPDAVARRRGRGQRTARENVAALCDPDTFVEYGPLVVAAQRQRRPLAELIERTPADGLVAGVAEINGRRCAVLAYDAHRVGRHPGRAQSPQARSAFDLAERQHLPVVLFAEGGGGRPGDTDIPTRLRFAGADVSAPSPGSADWCRWSVSRPADASRATPPCWAAATSSSPPRDATSAWAAPR